MSDEDVKEMIEAIERLRAAPYGFFSISDLSRAGPSSPQARNRLSLYSVRHPSPGTVCFGMGPLLRGVIALTTGLLRARKSTNAPPEFVATEADARAWVDDRRRRLVSLAG